MTQAELEQIQKSGLAGFLQAQTNPQPTSAEKDDLSPFVAALNLIRLPKRHLDAPPTFTPQNFADQIQVVDDGADKFLYVWINGTWVSINLAVPISVANGGTGLSSLGAAGEFLKVNSLGTALEFGAAADVYAMNSKLSTYNTFTIPLLSNAADSIGSILGAKQSGLNAANSEFHGSHAEFKSNSSTAYFYFKLPGNAGTSTINYQWGNNKKLIGTFKATYFGSTGCIWGFSTSNAGFYTLNHTASHSAKFEWDGANSKLYAVTSNGSANTRTDITGSLTVSNWHMYRIEVDLAAGTPNVKFYVNGTLKATHTTNLPSSSNVFFGTGLDTSDRWSYITAPIISIEE